MSIGFSIGFIKYQLDFNWIFKNKNIESIVYLAPAHPTISEKGLAWAQLDGPKLSKLGYQSLELGTAQPQLVIINFIKV